MSGEYNGLQTLKVSSAIVLYFMYVVSFTKFV